MQLHRSSLYHYHEYDLNLLNVVPFVSAHCSLLVLVNFKQIPVAPFYTERVLWLLSLIAKMLKCLVVYFLFQWLTRKNIGDVKSSWYFCRHLAIQVWYKSLRLNEHELKNILSNYQLTAPSTIQNMRQSKDIMCF